jgi:hypothetical protein
MTDPLQESSQRKRPFGTSGWSHSLNAEGSDFQEINSSSHARCKVHGAAAVIVPIAMPWILLTAHKGCP